MCLEEKVEAILVRQNEIDKKLSVIMERMVLKKTKTIKEIAIEMGKGVSWLNSHPWYIPNFGIPKLGESKRKRSYTIEELEEWNKIPLEKRREDYQKQELAIINTARGR